MKKLRLLFSMLCVCALSLTMSSQTTLIAFVADSDGPVTNIRSAPNGKIVAKLPTSKVYRMWVKNARNGWWQVSTVEEGENARTVNLTGARTYWVHSSVLMLNSNNYNGECYNIRKTPSSSGKVVYSFTHECSWRPLDIKGSWVKVRDVQGQYTGWIEWSHLCDNPYGPCDGTGGY